MGRARRAACLGTTAALLLGVTASGGLAAAAPSAPRCTVPESLPRPPSSRPHYTLRLRLSPDLRVAAGSLVATFVAPASAGTDRLVFRLWANGPIYARAGAHLSVSRVREGKRPLLVSRPDPTTLVVSRAVRPGARAVVSMDWHLVLPRAGGLRLRGGGGSVRLGSFFPLLAWNGHDWERDPPSATHPNAETWTSPVADFDVHVISPGNLQTLASGLQVRPGEWRAHAVRDFTLAVGRFTTAEGTAHVPAPVHVTVGIEITPDARAAKSVLRTAIASVQRYSGLYGPYPWPTFTVAAMADLPELVGGLEYPTLVYQPISADGVPHETAHQWFYSLVGNDQARDPWLDEGLTTWAESGVTGGPPFGSVPIPPTVADKIGMPMTFWDQFDAGQYYLGVYVQTYRALRGLGPRPVVDCALRLFVHRNAYRVAVPRNLLDALQVFFPDAEQRLEAHGARF